MRGWPLTSPMAQPGPAASMQQAGLRWDCGCPGGSHLPGCLSCSFLGPQVGPCRCRRRLPLAVRADGAADVGDSHPVPAAAICSPPAWRAAVPSHFLFWEAHDSHSVCSFPERDPLAPGGVSVLWRQLPMGALCRVSHAGVGVRLTPRQSSDRAVPFLVVWPRARCVTPDPVTGLCGSPDLGSTPRPPLCSCCPEHFLCVSSLALRYNLPGGGCWCQPTL